MTTYKIVLMFFFPALPASTLLRLNNKETIDNL